MEWLKKNGSLVLGIGLPVGLVVLFALAAWLPKLLVGPPKYDMLYMTNYNPANVNTIRYDVENKHLVLNFIGDNYGNHPQLYRYSAATGTVKEIPIRLPDSLPLRQYGQPMGHTQSIQVTPIHVPELDGLTIDESTTAPDGYEFHSDYGHSSGLVSDIFFSRNYNTAAALTKNGYSVRLTNGYGYGYFKFIGWVVP